MTICKKINKKERFKSRNHVSDETIKYWQHRLLIIRSNVFNQELQKKLNLNKPTQN
jgi:hypothetical protein